MAVEEPGPNPFVGPRPFEREERNRFFGREREQRELLSLLTAHRAVLLYARSGAGKTSLLNAGLIPLLETEGFQVLPTARVRGALPADRMPETITNLFVFNTLVSWAGDEGDPAALATTSLPAFLANRRSSADEPPPAVLIFDQLEELFTAHLERWQDREGFFRQLGEALEADPLLRVLLALREDYLARLDPYLHLLPERLRTRWRLVRLGTPGALAAVEGPLVDTGRRFAPGVARELVKELQEVPVETKAGETVKVRDDSVEPVQLQVVCAALWRDLPAETVEITRDHLQTFGDVDEALAAFYERGLDQVVAQCNLQEGELRRWFENTLITAAGTRGTAYQGQEQTSGIPNRAVQILEDLHLIRGEWRGGGRWYELAHDRFIEPILESNRRWLTHRVGAGAVLQYLESAAAVWTQGGRSREDLLSPAELIEAEHYLARPEVQEVGFDEAIVALVQASRAEAERSRARRLRGWVTAVSTLAVLALVAALFAWNQRRWAVTEAAAARRARQEAEEASRLAASRLLLFESQAATAEVPPHRQRSLLLAIEAMRRSPTLEGDQALRAGLEALWAWDPRPQQVDQRQVGRAVTGGSLLAGGGYLALSAEDGSTWLWRPTGPSALSRASSDATKAFAVSPSGRFLAGAGGGVARLWALSELLPSPPTSSMSSSVGEQSFAMEPVATTRDHGKPILAVAFVPGLEYLLTVDTDGVVRAWNEEGQQVEWSIGVDPGARAAVFSTNGRYLAVLRPDGSIHLQDLSGPSRPPGHFLQVGAVSQIAVSDNGDLLATSGDASSVEVREVLTGEVLATWAAGGSLEDFAFSPDGRFLATAGGGEVKLWEPTSGRLLGALPPGLQASGVAFTSDGRSLATASDSGTVGLWKLLRPPAEPVELPGASRFMTTTALSPDGRYVAVRGGLRFVASGQVWDLSQEKVTETRHRGLIAFAFSPGGDLLASSDDSGTAEIWDLDTDRRRGILQEGSPIYEMVFSPDGAYLVTLSSPRDRTPGDPGPDDEMAEPGRHSASFAVSVWAWETGQRLARIPTSGHPTAAAVRPGGVYLVIGDQGGTARLVEIGTTREVWRKQLEGPVVEAAFAPDGQTFALAVRGQVKGFALGQEEPIWVLPHPRVVRGFSFSPDGNELATACLDGYTRVWNLATGEERIRVAMGDAAEAVVFSPDGEYLWSSIAGSTPRKLPWRPEELVEEACSRLTRNFTRYEWRRYLGENLRYEKTCSALPDPGGPPPSPPSPPRRRGSTPASAG